MKIKTKQQKTERLLPVTWQSDKKVRESDVIFIDLCELSAAAAAYTRQDMK